MPVRKSRKCRPLDNGRPTIAVLTGSLASYYQVSIALGASDYARRRNVNTVTFAGGAFRHPDPLQVSRIRIFDVVDPAMFDGLIIPMGSHSRYITQDDIRAFLDQFAGIPVVTIDSHVEGVPNVTGDSVHGFTAMVEHLITVHGARKIAFARGPKTHGGSGVKMRAYAEVLARHGIEFDENLIAHGDLNRGAARVCVDQLYEERGLRPDAIVTVNDNMSLGIMDRLKERGLRVPDDVIVTGSMGIDEGLFYDPPLTTIKEPMYDLGWYAAEAIVDMLQGREVSQRIVVPTNLMIRRSCGCTEHEAEQYNKQAAGSSSKVASLLARVTRRDEAHLGLLADILNAAQGNARLTHASVDVAEVEIVTRMFYERLEDRNFERFVQALHAVFERYIRGEEITAWIDIIGVLQSHGQQRLTEAGAPEAAAEFVRQLDQLRNRVNAQVVAFRSYESDKYVNLSREISIALNASFNLDSIRKLLIRDIGVTDCYITVYEDKQNVRGTAKNLIAIKNGESVAVPEEQRRYPSSQLLPECILPYQDAYSFFALPLWFREEPIGYMVLNVCDRRGMVYENLQALLSGALKNEIQIHELRAAEERFSDIAHSTSDWLWEVDAECRYTYCSGGVVNVIGYTAEEMIGRTLFDFLVASEGEYLKQVRGKLIPQREPLNNLENVNLHKKGHEVTLVISGKPIIKDGRFVGYRGVFKDTTEIKQKENKIKLLAYNDTLTGLPNRTLFNDRLELMMATAKRDNVSFAVMFLDLDRFKNVNDTLGHDAGDMLLQSVAKRLKACIREVDTLARLGGDEFTILLGRVGNGERVAAVAKRIIASFNTPVEVKGHRLFVTTSVGIALFPKDGQDSQTLLKNADKAMYKAKEQGKNRFIFFDAEIEEKNARSMALEAVLHKALEYKEFRLVYQPQVKAATGELTGMEALIRLNSAELGPISPLEFIGLAEEIGLIEPIGEWVFSSACAQARQWSDAGHPVRVAVNVSARQFKNARLSDVFINLIKRHELDPSLIEIEITENAVIENEKLAKSTLQTLRDFGVSVALDDFGTGYSSLSSLKTFPIQTVKIDKSFIKDSTLSSDSANIINAIIHMARSLQLTVIAEGVETAEQMAFLQELGCDEIQGYLFSRPLPPEDLQDILKNGAIPLPV